MEFTTVRELYRETDRLVGTRVSVAGWIRTIRDQKRFAFIELNDGSFFRNLQVVVEADAIGNYDEIARLGTGAALVCEGVVVPTPGARQPFEMKAAAIRVEGACPPDYPLQPKRHTTEYLRTISHLRPRTNLFSAGPRASLQRIPFTGSS
jgi:asparaginyl-tRNA synthetase